ncbi:serine palmitoyltransferase component [Sporothrix eucalyptigena]
MSFGIGIMDVVGVTKFAWDLYKALRDSSEDFRRLSTEVASLHTVLLETEDYLRENDNDKTLDDVRRRRLSVLTECCQDSLTDLQRMLDNYESLGTQAQRTWDRMRWGLRDLSDVRLRLISNAATLGAFTSALSNASVARMDKRLAKFMTEVMAGLREGSVVTTSDVAETIDTPGVWDQLRRELEDVGISESVIEDNRDHIAAWFKDTLQDGLTVVDDTSADGSLSRMTSMSKTLSVDSGRISPTTVPPTDALSPGTMRPSLQAFSQSDYGGSTRGNSVSSMKSAMDGFAEDLKKNNNGKTIEESFQRSSRERPLHVVPKKKASPTRVLMKFLQKDDAIIQAASDGDIKKVAHLISLGMNVNARDRWGWSALSMCGYGGYSDIAKMLLDHGADLDNIDVDGESPEDLARNRGNRDMVLLFEEVRKERGQKVIDMDNEVPRKVEV